MVIVEHKYSDEYEKIKEDTLKKIAEREMDLSKDLFSSSAVALSQTSVTKVMENIRADGYINFLRDYLLKITLLQVPKIIIKTT